MWPCHVLGFTYALNGLATTLEFALRHRVPAIHKLNSDVPPAHEHDGSHRRFAPFLPRSWVIVSEPSRPLPLAASHARAVTWLVVKLAFLSLWALYAFQFERLDWGKTGWNDWVSLYVIRLGKKEGLPLKIPGQKKGWGNSESSLVVPRKYLPVPKMATLHLRSRML